MILKRLTSVLTIKRKTSTDRQPTGFLQNNAVVTNMVQDAAITTPKILDANVTTPKVADSNITPIKLSTKYESFDAVVGSPAQVTAGLASHSTVTTAIAAIASGGSILVLPGTYTENITLTQKVFMHGKGNSSNINGTLTMNAGSDLSTIKWLRFADNVTINSNGSFFKENFLASGKTVTNSGSGNSITWIQE